MLWCDEGSVTGLSMYATLEAGIRELENWGTEELRNECKSSLFL